MAKLTSVHNLAAVHPKIAKQWHPTLNGDLTPRRVTPPSGKLIWWCCQKGHEWQQRALYRRKSGSGCPNCAKRKVTKQNSLKRMNPRLAAQWHPTKNGVLLPQDVTQECGEKLWWICTKGHEWKSTVNNRTNGSGCPVCGREKAWKTRRKQVAGA